MSEFWTFLSGLLVSASGTYYAFLVFTRKAPSNPISWAAWSVVGVSLFLTSGVSFGINAVTFGMINPFLVTVAGIIRQKEKAEMPSKTQIVGGTLGALAIAAWLTAQKYAAPDEWILGFAIAADFIPLIPVIIGSWEKPEDDRPLAWTLFIVGFICMFLGLEERTIYTVAVPTYMVFGASLVAIPLIRYRLWTEAPLREWI